MAKVLGQDIQYFQEDFLENAKTQVVEGKEKEELFKKASLRGIMAKGSRDLAIFKTIYGFTDRANKNGAILPKDELLKTLPQIVGKPININHNRNLAVGHYIDYSYIAKENTIITYGVFYKSYFPKLWDQAKKLFKSKKLSSSFEIWSPLKSRKEREDGSYELYQMEMAGGALVYQDADNEPAFEGADVLAIAKAEDKELEKVLVYATKHKQDEILGANIWKDSIEENKKKIEDEKTKLQETAEQTQAEETQATEQIVEEQTPPAVPQLNCSNCNHKFESNEVTNVKCPNCFSILDSKGQMIYPPQVMDFKVSCPSCRANNWLITANSENASDVKCQSCSKDYTIKFKQEAIVDNDVRKIQFLYVGYVSCPQCSNSVELSGSSHHPERDANCNKCGLKFRVNTEKLESNRTVESIYEKTEEDNMTQEPEKQENVETPEVNEEQPKTEETQVTEETKVEEVKSEENTTEEPKAEEKEEVQETVTKSTVEKPEENAEGEEVETETTSEGSEDITVTVEGEEQQSETSNETPELSTEVVGVTQEELAQETEEPEQASSVEFDYKDALNRAVKKILELQDAKRTELAQAQISLEKATADVVEKITQETEAKISFYKANATKVVERRLELGQSYSQNLTDEDIVDDNIFEKAKLEKENTLLRARAESGDDVIGTKSSRSEDFFTKKQQEINEKAFRATNKKEQ